MEFCRRWGIADQVLDARFPLDCPKDVVFVTRLSRLRARPRAAPAASSARLRAQPGIHPDLLAALVRPDPAALRALLPERDAALWLPPRSVRAKRRRRDRERGRSRDRQATSASRRDYLVGCDGAGSIGAPRARHRARRQRHARASAVNMFFRAPGLLEPAARSPALSSSRSIAAGFGRISASSIRAAALWRLMVDETDAETRPKRSTRRPICAARSAGRFDGRMGRRQCLARRRALSPSAMASGRVFLAGDAVHQVSPTGALGMNTGIADAVDLGWKLAAVLQGWGGPSLLASYDAERRPAGARAVESATRFHAELDWMGRRARGAGSSRRGSAMRCASASARCWSGMSASSSAPWACRSATL